MSERICWNPTSKPLCVQSLIIGRLLWNLTDPVGSSFYNPKCVVHGPTPLTSTSWTVSGPTHSYRNSSTLARARCRPFPYLSADKSHPSPFGC